MSIFPIKPILDRIIIKKDSAEKNEHGFHLPETIKGRSNTGIVVALGPGRQNIETGEYLPMSVNVGDKVFLKEFDGYIFKWDGEDYFIFTEADIIGTIEE